MKTLSILIALCLFGMASPAMATYYGCTYRYYVTYHFSGFAYNKEVESVKVHTGVVQQKGMENSYWGSIKDLEMEKKGDHFYVKTELIGQQGGGDGNPNLVNLGPVVQYFVQFKDQTTLITPIWGILMNYSYNKFAVEEQVTQAIEKFNQVQDAKDTSGFRVGSGSGWCY
jgi:hypothetical protein